MKRILSIGLLSLSILFASCSNDDSSDSSNSSISATINGKEWKPTKIINVSLIKIPGEGQRFDISAQDNAQMLSFAFVSDVTTDDSMPVKAYNFYDDEENKVSDALFLNTYLIDGNTYTEHFPESGKITVTAIDAKKKTISGTFSFKNVKQGVLQTKVVTPEVVEVTNGVFTNLSYKVITTP